MNRFAKAAGLAAAALLTMTAAGNAQTPPPTYNWSGLYIGINGGGGWGHERLTSNAGNHYSYSIDGGLIGGTVGFNLQSGFWVAGLEGDVDWSNINGSGACAAQTCDTDVDWLGTARVRLGAAMGNFVVFGTGGLSFGGVGGTVSAPGGADTQTHVGWTAGAGVEAGVFDRFSVKAEWLYVDLGDRLYRIGSGVEFREVANLFRVGVNWRM